MASELMCEFLTIIKLTKGMNFYFLRFNDWVACKVTVPRRGSCKLCWRPNVVYTLINIRKNQFTAYIYIHYNQTLDEKSYISAKIEAVKHFQAVFC